jgi:hypothetical protein
VNNYENVFSAICKESCKNPDFTKEVIEGLCTLIVGSAGENLTVKELEKLSNDYYLISDFSVEFDPPIYKKRKTIGCLLFK